MNRMALLAVLAIVIIGVVGYFTVSMLSSAQTVSVGDTVNVYYSGAFTNGTVFNSNIGGQPFNFTVGANQVIPGFDKAVIGMHVNQTKTVTIPVNEAYGPINPSLIVSLPLKDFNNQSVRKGQIYTHTTPYGQRISGVVMEVNATNVTLNFNPALAGHVLVFTIKVISIKH